MSLPLFLVAELPAGDETELGGPEGRHAADVRRIGPGERLILADGRGAAVSVEVEATRPGTLRLRVIDRWYVEPPDPRLVVVQAVAKGDRGELAVQAMTEAGVDEIVPWSADRSVAVWRGERGERALERWRSTAREAAKQARRLRLPDVSAPVTTAAVAGRVTHVLHEGADARLSTVDLPRTGEIVLAVGPEGGVTPDELAAFEAAGAVPARLGDSVLRTSTAGVAALAVLSARVGRW